MPTNTAQNDSAEPLKPPTYRFATRKTGLADSHPLLRGADRLIQIRSYVVSMDFTLIERRWLREVVKEVTWVRMARQGVGPTSYRTLMHVAHFERWAEQRLDPGPEAIDRRLLEDYLTHVRRLPYSAAEREHRLVSLDAMELKELAKRYGHRYPLLNVFVPLELGPAYPSTTSAYQRPGKHELMLVVSWSGFASLTGDSPLSPISCQPEPVSWNARTRTRLWYDHCDPPQLTPPVKLMPIVVPAPLGVYAVTEQFSPGIPTVWVADAIAGTASVAATIDATRRPFRRFIISESTR